MPNPPTVREILARALATNWARNDTARRSQAIILLNALEEAGIPESQLDALLRGEAVVLSKEQHTAEIQDAYSTGYGDGHGRRQASQESGE